MLYKMWVSYSVESRAIRGGARFVVGFVESIA